MYYSIEISFINTKVADKTNCIADSQVFNVVSDRCLSNLQNEIISLPVHLKKMPDNASILNIFRLHWILAIHCCLLLFL